MQINLHRVFLFIIHEIMQINLHRILLFIIYKSKLRALNGANVCIPLDTAFPTVTYGDKFTKYIAIHHCRVKSKATE